VSRGDGLRRAGKAVPGGVAPHHHERRRQLGFGGPPQASHACGNSFPQRPSPSSDFNATPQFLQVSLPRGRVEEDLAVGLQEIGKLCAEQLCDGRPNPRSWIERVDPDPVDAPISGRLELGIVVAGWERDDRMETLYGMTARPEKPIGR
jgi:hypothetical protein